MRYHDPKRERAILLCALAGVAAFGATFHARRTAAPESSHLTAEVAEPWIGVQVLIILVGSSGCGFSNDVKGRQAFWALVEDARNAESDGLKVNTIGVAVDMDPVAGWNMLRGLGRFDEYAVGNGWLSTAAVQYVVRDFAGAPVVPQVLVISRSVAVGAAFDVGTDSLHVRLVGVDAITRWAQRLEGRQTPGPNRIVKNPEVRETRR